MQCDAIRSNARTVSSKRRRRSNSQIIEREQLRNTAKDHKHSNGEVHHATRHASSATITSKRVNLELSQKLLPSCSSERNQLTRYRKSPWRANWRDVGTAVWRLCFERWTDACWEGILGSKCGLIVEGWCVAQHDTTRCEVGRDGVGKPRCGVELGGLKRHSGRANERSSRVLIMSAPSR